MKFGFLPFSVKSQGFHFSIDYLYMKKLFWVEAQKVYESGEHNGNGVVGCKGNMTRILKKI